MTAGKNNERELQERKTRGDNRREEREGTAGKVNVRKGENGAGLEVE